MPVAKNDRSLHIRSIGKSIVILILLALSSACSIGGTKSTVSTPTASSVLPGQQVWKQGVSSFLFGTNDSYEWTSQNIQTEPSIQDALREAGFSIIRSFFPNNASNTAIDQRIATIKNSGAQCLGVITDIFNTNFDEHLVRYLGKQCLIYEFGNEPDYNGISIERYLSAWNKTIPLLRAINPLAKFIGPVTYNDQGLHGFMGAYLQGVKSSGVLPDAVSFHWYPCWQDTKDSCLAKATSYVQVTTGLRQQIHTILGKDLPIGISEWNYDPGNPPPAYGDDANFIKQFSTNALKSMMQAGVAFACQFDAASYGGYGRLDMFDINDGHAKPQYYAIKDLIQQYRPAPTDTSSNTSVSHAAGPLISLGQPTYCSGDDAGAGGPQSLVDGHYGNWGFWRSHLTTLPNWCAIHLTNAHPTRLLLIWSSDYSFDYISNTSMSPQDYTIAVSADSTTGADGTWQTLVTVVGNHTRVREHLLPFIGQSWIKMTVTKGQAQASQAFMTIDEIALYDVSNSLNDTFIFSGDSITAMGYNGFDEDQPSFAVDVHTAFPQHFPAMIDAGLGGWTSDGAVQNIDMWLTLNPDIHYWALGWGTNDSFAQVDPAHFRANLQQIITKIKQQGHIPVLAHIPYANKGTAFDQEIQALNGVIDQLITTNGLLHGPDLYALFQAHASTYLLEDGIHPTAAGAIAMNRAWFDVLKSSLYENNANS